MVYDPIAPSCDRLSPLGIGLTTVALYLGAARNLYDRSDRLIYIIEMIRISDDAFPNSLARNLRGRFGSIYGVEVSAIARHDGAIFYLLYCYPGIEAPRGSAARQGLGELNW